MYVYNIITQEGFTALMIAIQSGRTVKRDILLGGDIDLNVVDRVSTILHNNYIYIIHT